jgi:hypothetical protein
MKHKLKLPIITFTSLTFLIACGPSLEEKKKAEENRVADSINMVTRYQDSLAAVEYNNYQDESSQVNTAIENEPSKQEEEQVFLSDESSLIAYLSGKTFHGTNVTIEINPSSIDIDGVNRYFNISFSVISPTLGKVRGESLSNPDGVIYITVNTQTGCIENDGGSFCQ